MKNKDTYLAPSISDLPIDADYPWLDIDIDEMEKGKKKKKKKKQQKKKKKKKAAKKRKKAIKKKKAAKKEKQKKRAEKQRAQEFRYQLLLKATDTACDITKMYFYSKFGSPT